MADEGRLTVGECWAKLQQIDEALASLPPDKGCMARMGRLLANRQFFEVQLERRLRRQSPYREILKLKAKEKRREQQPQ